MRREFRSRLIPRLMEPFQVCIKRTLSATGEAHQYDPVGRDPGCFARMSIALNGGQQINRGSAWATPTVAVSPGINFA
jgi:hypothetical protein